MPDHQKPSATCFFGFERKHVFRVSRWRESYFFDESDKKVPALFSSSRVLLEKKSVTLNSIKTLGICCGTVVASKSSRGSGFDSRRVLGFFSSHLSVLNLVPLGNATLLISLWKKWKLSCAAWSKTSLTCAETTKNIQTLLGLSCKEVNTTTLV